MDYRVGLNDILRSRADVVASRQSPTVIQLHTCVTYKRRIKGWGYGIKDRVKRYIEE
jgi:hypothetical protein